MDLNPSYFNGKITRNALGQLAELEGSYPQKSENRWI
jgi:hypothetical protein